MWGYSLSTTMRPTTLQDIGKAQEDLKAKQLQKEAEQKRRGSCADRPSPPSCLTPRIPTEKEEDARARAAIKAQIEADKRERAEKAAREKALREGKTVPEASGSAPAAAAAIVPSSVAGKDFKETRLQIRRASGGTPLTTTLSSDARKSAPSFL